VIRGFLFVAAGVALLLLVGARSQWSLGEHAMRDSDAFLARGQARPSIVAARLAAEAAVPWSPYPAMGYARLEALARAAEVEGKPEDAAFAWRAMRSAAVATRPAAAGRDKIALADEGILRVARMPARDGVGSAPPAILTSQLEER
jgi:hypothetical protein